MIDPDLITAVNRRLTQHQKWLRDKTDGQRASLAELNLSGYDLHGGFAASRFA
jgi:hypothetical protein